MSEGKKEILLGDCLELMKDIPNGSIDMILCDLPYGTTACKWDTIIPFDKLWGQYERIIKPNGAIVLTASQPFTTDLINSKRNLFKYELIWNKISVSNPFSVKYSPLKCHENIIIFCKTTPKYNAQVVEKPKNERRPIRKPHYGIDKTPKDGVYGNAKKGHGINFDDSIKHPKSIIEIPAVYAKHRIHPTEKSVALFEWLIKSYTDENDLVLDNTAGSGTTAIACLNTNRQFIVMEKEQKYYDIILKRVEDFNKNFEPKTLFGNEM